MKTLVIATRNTHKVAEIQALLQDRCRCVGLAGWGSRVPETVEDQASFAGNAVKKALTVASWLATEVDVLTELGGASVVGVLADDSGLEVDALSGGPGVHSARFAALDDPSRTGNSPDSDNNAKLLRLLADVPVDRRTARFRCALAWIPAVASSPASAPRLFEGACEGRITQAPSGQGGFGYDPLFVPAGQSLSFAELGSELKNQISHRAQALRQFRAVF
jgi:XTP/dITP diphosphohydrolase